MKKTIKSAAGYVVLLVLSAFAAVTLASNFGLASDAWKPNLWTPTAMEEPITVHIVSKKEFALRRLLSGAKRGTGAFLETWVDEKTGKKTFVMYLQPDMLGLFVHEVRHAQEGAFHK